MNERPDFFEDDDDDLDIPPSFFPDEIAHGSGVPVAVVVKGVQGVEYTTQDNRSVVERCVVLEDQEGRTLRLVIGPFESLSIGFALEGAKPDRPLTHDLMKNILERMGAEVDRVVIDDLWNNTYYAKLYITQGDKEYEIDARPSDAIALVLRFHPERPRIYVLESVFEAAGEREDGDF